MDPSASQNRAAASGRKLTLQLYRRCFKGRKQLFAESDTAAASYFVTNPVPHKHSSNWKPIFYRGDNPKYTPTATAIGRARRSAMWGTFRVWIGDGVQEVLDNERRRREKRKAERKNRWRKRFGRGVKPVDVEEEKEVQGKVVMFRMQRKGLFTRSVEWELEGVRYRWSGTRMFATGFMKGVKGWSHSMKLIRMSDHALIASFEKHILGSRRSIKTGGPPNKSKMLLGKLSLYNFPDEADKQGTKTGHDRLTNLVAQVDAVNSKRSDLKDEEHLNPDGIHSGSLTEDAIAFTCWIAVEAEHRLRYKIPDFLEEVAENVEGG
ncbi:predicted protein [Aspergillus nidulans FGSC A4]|uniref:Uncharacterized protein n=1 Tax=Emericella nidulans (strain FGSC A4 / ATCC 38163 / CBS 112.46 / NRRL 194 / M139) TaxID=227321 RepID=Q5B656_EMENI|nr:hypothetical protein [Aspergillus nidulans FGSC A4]EAA59445.1 predicted protein [Aspergillus nidulans FGSC A4]CBF74971.1 TPA: conserved hypothetical protein [Aspergillus nidulans FGSC A4]|eukprot:XP_661578.1 predicted protein [Aspergillus nidulans FGSC A4]